MDPLRAGPTAHQGADGLPPNRCDRDNDDDPPPHEGFAEYHGEAVTSLPHLSVAPLSPPPPRHDTVDASAALGATQQQRRRRREGRHCGHACHGLRASRSRTTMMWKTSAVVPVALVSAIGAAAAASVGATGVLPPRVAATDAGAPAPGTAATSAPPVLAPTTNHTSSDPAEHRARTAAVHVPLDTAAFSTASRHLSRRKRPGRGSEKNRRDERAGHDTADRAPRQELHR
ncbi:hypothetical protein Q4I28_000606 [Leishmania naiffi]|uniref:Uncharacterized protein n=1 Tax=Leishmania naiffi TaxID=5678 RepID=A0AAW3C8Z1_9TRYP